MVRRITNKQLDELQRLYEGGSDGPWRAEHYTDRSEAFTVESATGIVCAITDADSGDMGERARAAAEKDFALIVAARNCLPTLIAEVHRLRKASRRSLVG